MKDPSGPIITYAKSDILGATRVCALIPAYNESERIASTIQSLRNRREITSVVVINDGSTDDSEAIAAAAGATLVLSQKNAGKGSALSAGYEKAREMADVFLLLDADLGMTASEAVKLLGPIVRNKADMVIGKLPPDPAFAESGESGGTGLVVNLARNGIRKATGHSFEQPLSGQRAVRKEVLEFIRNLSSARETGLFANGFGVEVGLTIAALRAGFRVLEVETQFRHNVTGSDWTGLVHRARQYLDVAQVLRRSA